MREAFLMLKNGNFTPSNGNTESQISNSDNNFDLNKSRDLNNIYRAFSLKLKNNSLDELDDKNFESLLDNLPTYSEPPEALINELKFTNNEDDAKQITKEAEAFDSFKKLELLYSLYMIDKESFKDAFFLDTFIAFKILNSYNSHMHMKYYKSLSDKYGINMLKFLKDFLVEHLKSEKVIRLKLYESLDELVYKLTWTLIRNEKYEFAEQLIEEYLNYLDFLEEYLKNLNEENNNVNKDTLKSFSSIMSIKFYALSNLIIVKNYLLKFKEGLSLFESTNSLLKNIHKSKTILVLIKFKIILMCLLIDGEEVNCTNFYYGVGNIFLEQGLLNRSFEYLNMSLSVIYFLKILNDRIL